MITYRHLGRAGRLGNQLWEIAGTIAIANRKGDQAGFPFWRYAEYFRIPNNYFPALSGLELAGIDAEDVGRDLLQDINYLSGIEERIRDFFGPRSNIESILRRRYAEFYALPHKTAITVRRGDYLLIPELIPALPLDYYHEAMEIQDPPYVVFSDDIDWCEQHFPPDCLFMRYNRDYEDLFLIAACDRHIVANSSFAWWGAWLSEHESDAVYPKRWYGRAVTHIDTSVLYPAGATVI